MFSSEWPMLKLDINPLILAMDKGLRFKVALENEALITDWLIQNVKPIPIPSLAIFIIQR